MASLLGQSDLLLARLNLADRGTPRGAWFRSGTGGPPRRSTSARSLEDYILGKPLHSTEHSRVYAAVRGDDQTQVVLKAHARDMMPHGESRASWEFEVMRSLEGVGIPRPVELVDSSTGPVLVLERRPGVSLWTWVDRQLPMIEAVIEVAIQLTSTLVRVHERRLIHRDVNPSNVLVDPSTLERSSTTASPSSYCSGSLRPRFPIEPYSSRITSIARPRS